MTRPRRRRLWPVLILLLLLLPVLLLSLALQQEPSLPAAQAGADAQLASQARLLWAQLRPGAAPVGALRHTRIGERELNALLAQAAQAKAAAWRARFAIDEGELRLEASQPAGAFLWLNLQLAWDLRQPRPGELPPLRSARLGRLPLPPSWAEALAWRALQARSGFSVEALLPMLEGYRARPRQLWLQWRWQPQQAAAALAGLWSEAERKALRAQHQLLLELLVGVQPHHGVALPTLLTPMARAAQARVDAQGADAATELRALWAVLTLQSLGRDIRNWVPEAGELPPAPPVLLLLAGREDMAMHFLLSALLSWQGGEGITKALGLAKELADARSGSGFSFNDLAADEAGQRLGQLAARQPALLLARLAEGQPASSYFPDIGGLPEFLSEREFRQRYGQLGSPAYEEEMTRLRLRVAELPLFQGLPGL